MPQIGGDHGDGVSEEIAKLAALRDQGVLTEKEFQSQKKALLRANQSRLGMVGQSFLTPARLIAIGAVIVVIVALVVIRPGSSKPAQLSTTNVSTATSSKATAADTEAVDWATAAMIRDTAPNEPSSVSFDGLCLSLVTDAYQGGPDGPDLNIRPLSKLYTSNGHNWNVYPELVWNDGFNRGITGGKNSVPPYGALVFFTVPQTDTSQYEDTHVTIMGLNGEMISSPDVTEWSGAAGHDNNYIHLETLQAVAASPAYSKYAGWWLPDGTNPQPPPVTATSTSTPSNAATPATAAPSSGTKAPTATPSTGGSTNPTPSTIPTVAPTQTPQPPPVTYSETAGGVAHTWTDYANAGGNEGPSIAAYQTVQISCKVTGFAVADGNTWWYRIASSPWNNAYYVSADAFYNNGSTSGPLKGTPFVDPNVPNC